MDTLKALHSRISIPRVTGPVPSAAEIENLYRAALRAPDHAQLRPWRFLQIEGEALERLGDLFVAASRTDNPELTAAAADSIRAKALRAPMIIVTISCPIEHPKVPQLEQDISAGCATHAMLIAAHAQGIGAVWRTGPLSEHPVILEGLGLKPNEKINAMLYIGQNSGPQRSLKELDVKDFVKHW
ncbi:MAG: nitroreductase family protein [Gammaproteobacteria bacterium]